jgi:hypothetical protein
MWVSRIRRTIMRIAVTTVVLAAAVLYLPANPAAAATYDFVQTGSNIPSFEVTGTISNLPDIVSSTSQPNFGPLASLTITFVDAPTDLDLVTTLADFTAENPNYYDFPMWSISGTSIFFESELEDYEFETSDGTFTIRTDEPACFYAPCIVSGQWDPVPEPVPEPASALLLISALIGFAVMTKRRPMTWATGTPAAST